MPKTEAPTDYVISHELKFNGTYALIKCYGGDEYWVAREGGKWWLQFIPGEPSEGPFADLDAVIDWLNTDQ